MQKAAPATPAEAQDHSLIATDCQELPVQLAGGGIISAPAEEAAEARHAAQLSVLLSGKPSKAWSAAPSSKAAAAGLGLLGTTTSPFSPAQSNTKLYRDGPQATYAARLSLASMGLLAAPDAAGLPGGWLNGLTAAGGSPGVLGWEPASSGAQASTAATRTRGQHAGGWQHNPPLQPDLSGIGWCGDAPSQSITVGSTGPPSTHWRQTSKLQDSSSGTAAAAVRPAATQGNTASVAAALAAAAGSHGSRPSTAAAAAAAAAGEPAHREGTAAFRAPDRAAANLAGRVRAAPQADLPGPGQFRPLHSVVDKHVPGVTLGPPSRTATTAAGCRASSGAGSPAHQQDPRQQHPRQGPAAQQPCPPGAAPAAAAGGGHRASTGHRVSTTAAEGLRRSSACTLGTPLGTTPRSANDDDLAREGAAGQTQGKEQQQRWQRGGTAAFKAVSRDQAAAVAAGRGRADNSRGGGGDQQQGQQQVAESRHQARPVSRGLDWSRQTQRPPGSAPTCSPPALGPGSYFRRGPLPASLTGSSCLAGHDPAAAAPDFGAAPSRQQGSSSRACAGHVGCWDGHLAGACSLGHTCPAAQQAAELGTWAWPAGDQASPVGHHAACRGVLEQASPCTHMQPAGGGMAAVQQQEQLRPCSGTRPASAALDYARAQCGAVLVAPAAAAADGGTSTGAGGLAWLMGPQADCAEQTAANMPTQQHQPQQQRLLSAQRPSSDPSAAGRLHAAAAPRHSHQQRPGTAGAVLLGGARPRPTSCHAQQGRRPNSSSRSCLQQRPHSRGDPGAACRGAQEAVDPNSSGTNGLGVQQLQRYSSTGFAARVKGGRFPDCGRESNGGTAASSRTAGAELLYSPQPEVQGHMRRAPGWALPPNRVETSRKWARAAAQAALQ